MLSHTIERTAHIAWSPKFQDESFVACGTAMCDSNHFSYQKESSLELFDLSSDSPTHLVSVNVPSKFSRILWTSIEGGSKDIIVGGFEDGHVEFWDSQCLIDSRPNSMIEARNIHSGPVKGLGRSAFQPNLIATGASNSEIALWDLNAIDKTSILGIKKSSQFKNVSDISWNARAPHIIASASDSGIVSILDLRSKKEVMTLSVSPEISISSIAWNPTDGTSIASASETDSTPFVYSWDLRSYSAPKSVFKGHTKGVLSLSWCPKDPELMLSSGKDRNVMCWNPSSNEVVNEFTHSSEVFEVQWSFKDQNIFSCADFDGNIHIRSYPPEKVEAVIESLAESEAVTAEESICSEVGSNENSNSFSGPKAGVSFGGSNICSIFNSLQKSVFLLKPDLIKSDIIDKLTEFENILQSEGPAGVCANVLQYFNLSEDFVLIWKFIKCFTLQDCRSELFEIISATGSSDDSDNVLDNEILNYIICSDIEGAVEACIKAKRYSDALFLSSSSGFENELHRKVEDVFIKESNSLYLRIAHGIRRNDISDCIKETPLKEWKILIKLICAHSTPETLGFHSNLLLNRLINEDERFGFEEAVGFVLVLSGKMEEFLKFVLISNPIQIANNFDSILSIFMIIRVFERISPDFVFNLTDQFVEISIFEIYLKMRLLTPAEEQQCSYLDERTVMFMNNVYKKNFEGKNANLDVFMEHEFNNNVLLVKNDTAAAAAADVLSHRLGSMHMSASQDLQFQAYNSASYTEEPYNYNHYGNNNTNQTTHHVPQQSPSSSSYFSANQQSPSSSITNSSAKKYNDAPIISPRNSVLSTITETDLELSPTIIRSALEKLFKESSLKASASQVRIVKDCTQRLSAEIICSKEYSSASKLYIINLFDSFNTNNFDKATKIISTLLLTYYEEVKEWILLVKRLQDIVKIQN